MYTAKIQLKIEGIQMVRVGMTSCNLPKAAQEHVPVLFDLRASEFTFANQPLRLNEEDSGCTRQLVDGDTRETVSIPVVQSSQVCKLLSAHTSCPRGAHTFGESVSSVIVGNEPDRCSPRTITSRYLSDRLAC
jgi:hypothetical protein